MAEPLKNMFSRALLAPFAAELQLQWPAFQVEAFLERLFDDSWAPLELKQRIRRISVVLRDFLPAAYPEALEVLIALAQRRLMLQGEQLSFEYIFLPDFIEVHGVDDPEPSIAAMEVFTRWSSAEFAVRPFLIRYPARMYAQMLAWSRHPSPMVRRLSSEGIRPRLPWGMGVPGLKRDPSPILPILENLKNDPAETVRRSVANNLNDIAKDHPDLVLDIAERWRGISSETDWIIRHACRGLLKKGHPAALARFGFRKGVAGIAVENLQAPASIPMGGVLDFSFTLRNHGGTPARTRVEYGIEYQTLSGKISYKVFKIKEMEMSPGQEDAIVRRQRFQDFTTRKHYPGLHRLCILVNGLPLATADFELLPAV